jgi:hypothetical protein
MLRPREDVNRYLSRNPDFWAKHGGKAVDDVVIAKDIICRTPSPEPAPSSQTPSVPRSLDPADDLHVHEDILRLFQAYTEGSFEKGLWQLSPTHKRYYGPGGVEANARLNAWYDRLRNVADWPGGERDADAVRLVNHLLDDLPQLIRDQDYTVFPALLRCCFYLSARRPAVGAAVVRFVARLCAVLLGPRHPMTLAWSRIRLLALPEYLVVLQGTAKFRLDRTTVGKAPAAAQAEGLLDAASLSSDENAINALREYLLVLRLRGQAAVREIDRITSKVMEELDPPAQNVLSSAQCRLLLGTASCYITRGQFEAAERILDFVGAKIPAPSPLNPYSQRILSTYLFIMGFLRYVTGRPDEALNYFLRTYYALEKAAGPHSSAVADILVALIDLPGLLQKPEDVEYWQRKLAQVQSDMLARAEKGIRYTETELSELWDEPLDMDVNTSAW